MYDTLVFPKEPGGFAGGISIIDMNNMPVMLTANELRDGALRSMV
jgi:D-proline reductase (dithiol) PrdD